MRVYLHVERFTRRTTHLQLTERVTKTREEAVGSDTHRRLDVAVDDNCSVADVSFSWENGVDQSSTVFLRGSSKKMFRNRRKLTKGSFLGRTPLPGRHIRR